MESVSKEMAAVAAERKERVRAYQTKARLSKPRAASLATLLQAYQV